MRGYTMPDHYKDQLLDCLFHYMDQDLRKRVMVEVPMAYNMYVEKDICEVLIRDHESPYHVELQGHRSVVMPRRGLAIKAHLGEPRPA